MPSFYPEAHTKITAMQTAMKDADDDEKLILCGEANEVYQACLKIVSKNVVNDHILCMLLSEIDYPDKSKYDIKSARYLLFASLLYTLQPIQPIEKGYFQRKLREVEAKMHFNNVPPSVR